MMKPAASHIEILRIATHLTRSYWQDAELYTQSEIDSSGQPSRMLVGGMKGGLSDWKRLHVCVGAVSMFLSFFFFF